MGDILLNEEPPFWSVMINISLTYTFICAMATEGLRLVAMALIVMLLALQGVIVGPELHYSRRHKSMPWLVLIWLVSTLSALYVGSRNYHKAYAPYELANSGRDYRDVPAGAMASGYLDGRTINFDASFVLDDTRSVGFKAFGSTYCAAPVLSTSDTEALDDYLVVQFWAVGLDCCGARGDFLCDDAGEADVHKGIVMHDPAESETLVSALLAPRLFKSGYSRAIAASCALYEMQTSADPVLIAWVKEPDDVLRGWLTTALLVWAGSSVAHFVLALGAWKLVQISGNPQSPDKLWRGRPLRHNSSFGLNQP